MQLDSARSEENALACQHSAIGSLTSPLRSLQISNEFPDSVRSNKKESVPRFDHDRLDLRHRDESDSFQEGCDRLLMEAHQRCINLEDSADHISLLVVQLRPAETSTMKVSDIID